LAGPWKPERLERMAEVIELGELPPRFDEILAGRITGRVVVKIGQEQSGAQEPGAGTAGS
jgi:hypothetical protein